MKNQPKTPGTAAIVAGQHLNVATLPLPILWGDKEANMKAVEAALGRLREGTDLLVLPELFTTGYSDDPQAMGELAEPLSGPTVSRIHEWARRHNAAIAGSFLARTANRLYNRGFFIEPSGEETFYDKRHLFTLSREPSIISQGQDPVRIVRYRGWNVALVVCYDLRFPVWCRNVRNAYDVLLVCANWPKARGYAWEHLLIARAIETQACVVGGNRGGRDTYGDYEGLSQIYDGRGYPVGVVDEATGIIYASLDKARQEDYRRNFPVVDSSDDFSLEGF